MNDTRTLPCALVLVLATACAGAQASTAVVASKPAVLSEEQALQVIRETLAHKGTAVVREWPLRLGQAEQLVVDARLGNQPLAIEWVSDEDRSAHGAVLPEVDEDEPLRIITGTTEDQRVAQVLVLDAHAYGYEGNPQLVQRGALSIVEAEDRVRRDVLEFLEYAREQGL